MKIDENYDEIEDLPSRDAIRPRGVWFRYGEDMPWKKVHRFLVSRVGEFWNDIFSEYVHLEWVPEKYKTREQIANSVLVNTYMKDGKVYYFDKYCDRDNNEKTIDDYRFGYGDCFYVHPITGKLCYRQTKKSCHKKEHAEKLAKTFRILGDYHQLIKRNGVWYEVKGKPIESDVVIIDGLHYKYIKSIPEIEQSDTYFFGRKVVPDKLPYKIFNGRYIVPHTYHNKGKPIGPRDCMDKSVDYNTSFYNRFDYDSIKITLSRQLNKKELKKYGLTNDKKTIGKSCAVCGMLNCMINHNPTGTHMKKKE